MAEKSSAGTEGSRVPEEDRFLCHDYFLLVNKNCQQLGVIGGKITRQVHVINQSHVSTPN